MENMVQEIIKFKDLEGETIEILKFHITKDYSIVFKPWQGSDIEVCNEYKYGSCITNVIIGYIKCRSFFSELDVPFDGISLEIIAHYIKGMPD